MKIKRIKLAHIKQTVLTISLFLTSLTFLIGVPQMVKLAQSQVKASYEQPFSAYDLDSQVLGEAQPTLQIKDTGVTPPSFSAQAVLVKDFETGQIIYQKNIDQKLSPASTTKLMTALVALEHFQPADILIVYPQGLVDGSTMGLKSGEKLTFRSLLYGMLLNSGNDAAYTIALNYPGGMENFIAKMNQKSKLLGLQNTNFQNPAGFDGANHFSSAYDLSMIAIEVMKNPQLAKIVSTKETSVISYDQSNLHVLKNLNELLGEGGVIGIKTGFTEKSGENLIGLVERANRKILTVVLSSNDRFEETKSLINWVYSNFVWQITR